MKLNGTAYKFILTQTSKDCAGSFNGQLTLDNGKFSGTYSGNDCRGWHENGVVSMVRTSGEVSLGTVEQQGSVRCKAGDAAALLWRNGTIVRKLQCNEKLTLVGKPGAGYIHIRTADKEEGYVSSESVTEEKPSEMGTNPIVKQISPDTVLKAPTRMPLAQELNHEQEPVEYPLTVRFETPPPPYWTE